MKKILLTLILIILNCKENFDAKYLNLELENISAKKEKLKDYRGKIIFLDFWASWCEPCKKSVPKIDKIREATKDIKIEFLGINTDSSKTLEEIKEVSKEFQIKYKSLLDPKLELVHELNVEGQPAFLVFDKYGKEKYRQYGIISTDIPKILKIIRDLEKD